MPTQKQLKTTQKIGGKAPTTPAKAPAKTQGGKAPTTPAKAPAKTQGGKAPTTPAKAPAKTQGGKAPTTSAKSPAKTHGGKAPTTPAKALAKTQGGKAPTTPAKALAKTQGGKAHTTPAKAPAKSVRVGSAKGGSTKNPRQHVRGIHKGGTNEMNYINELVKVTNLKNFINVYSEKRGRCINLTLNKIDKDYPDNWKKKFDGTDFSSEIDLTNKLSMLYNAIHYVTKQCPNEFRKYIIEGSTLRIKQNEFEKLYMDKYKAITTEPYKSDIKTKIIEPLIPILYIGAIFHDWTKSSNPNLRFTFAEKTKELSDTFRFYKNNGDYGPVGSIETNVINVINNKTDRQIYYKTEGNKFTHFYNDMLNDVINYYSNYNYNTFVIKEKLLDVNIIDKLLKKYTIPTEGFSLIEKWDDLKGTIRNSKFDAVISSNNNNTELKAIMVYQQIENYKKNAFNGLRSKPIITQVLYLCSKNNLDCGKLLFNQYNLKSNELLLVERNTNYISRNPKKPDDKEKFYDLLRINDKIPFTEYVKFPDDLNPKRNFNDNEANWISNCFDYQNLYHVWGGSEIKNYIDNFCTTNINYIENIKIEENENYLLRHNLNYKNL